MICTLELCWSKWNLPHACLQTSNSTFHTQNYEWGQTMLTTWTLQTWTIQTMLTTWTKRTSVFERPKRISVFFAPAVSFVLTTCSWAPNVGHALHAFANRSFTCGCGTPVYWHCNNRLRVKLQWMRWFQKVHIVCVFLIVQRSFWKSPHPNNYICQPGSPMYPLNSCHLFQVMPYIRIFSLNAIDIWVRDYVKITHSTMSITQSKNALTNDPHHFSNGSNV